MIKTVDTDYYNFKPKRDEMKTLLSVAMLALCALFLHITSAAGMGITTEYGEKSLESSTVPAYIGIFTFQSSDSIANSHPSISASDASPSASNATEDWLTQFDPFTPRNAYSNFVSQVNQTVQAIFWGQFNYTEQKTNEGLAAMNQAKQNGSNAEQIRDAFIQNASTSRSDITTVNNNLNVQYGHANSTVQAKFDKYGNLR